MTLVFMAFLFLTACRSTGSLPAGKYGKGYLSRRFAGLGKNSNPPSQRCWELLASCATRCRRLLRRLCLTHLATRRLRVARMIGVVGAGCVAVWGGTPEAAGGVHRGARRRCSTWATALAQMWLM